eukprot:gb/GECH01011988.1/.p1 GENE.gb/GECH01011988.1/~~gb/GECH01011988.1/.p1  ORF type:complete len:648 (+),score=163.04 gb/GECH01011988.1/:1-1944(+)
MDGGFDFEEAWEQDVLAKINYLEDHRSKLKNKRELLEKRCERLANEIGYVDHHQLKKLKKKLKHEENLSFDADERNKKLIFESQEAENRLTNYEKQTTKSTALLKQHKNKFFQHILNNYTEIEESKKEYALSYLDRVERQVKKIRDIRDRVNEDFQDEQELRKDINLKQTEYDDIIQEAKEQAEQRKRSREESRRKNHHREHRSRSKKIKETRSNSNDNHNLSQKKRDLTPYKDYQSVYQQSKVPISNDGAPNGKTKSPHKISNERNTAKDIPGENKSANENDIHIKSQHDVKRKLKFRENSSRNATDEETTFELSPPSTTEAVVSSQPENSFSVHQHSNNQNKNQDSSNSNNAESRTRYTSSSPSEDLDFTPENYGNEAEGDNKYSDKNDYEKQQDNNINTQNSDLDSQRDQEKSEMKTDGDHEKNLNSNQDDMEDKDQDDQEKEEGEQNISLSSEESINPEKMETTERIRILHELMRNIEFILKQQSGMISPRHHPYGTEWSIEDNSLRRLIMDASENRSIAGNDVSLMCGAVLLLVATVPGGMISGDFYDKYILNEKSKLKQDDILKFHNTETGEIWQLLIDHLIRCKRFDNRCKNVIFQSMAAALVPVWVDDKSVSPVKDQIAKILNSVTSPKSSSPFSLFGL